MYFLSLIPYQRTLRSVLSYSLFPLCSLEARPPQEEPLGSGMAPYNRWPIALNQPGSFSVEIRQIPQLQPQTWLKIDRYKKNLFIPCRETMWQLLLLSLPTRDQVCPPLRSLWCDHVTKDIAQLPEHYQKNFNDNCYWANTLQTRQIWAGLTR